jgi:hypothetical protein
VSRKLHDSGDALGAVGVLSSSSSHSSSLFLFDCPISKGVLEESLLQQQGLVVVERCQLDKWSRNYFFEDCGLDLRASDTAYFIFVLEVFIGICVVRGLNHLHVKHSLPNVGFLPLFLESACFLDNLGVSP